MRKPIIRALAVAMAGWAAGSIGLGDARAALLDPLNFTSLGALPGGDITFNTDALTFNGTAGGVVQSQVGGPNVAVFTFNTSTLASGATITGTGSRPLVLLFQGSFTISGTFNVSGQNGGISTLLGPLGQRTGGPGGAGGPGGGAGGNGNGQVIIGGSAVCCAGATAGGGPGGGGGGGFVGGSSAGGGGGGSFGSAGRDGGGNVPGAAGPTYGNLIIAVQGGSGGGGGGGNTGVGLANGPGRGGGGGGGGLQIGALSSINLVGGTINANGGNEGVPALVGNPGGGGSGGGILLHAFNINLDSNTVLQAMGGNGTLNSGAGCGGGGRISTVTNTSGALSNAGATINTNGGFDPANRCGAGSMLFTTDPNVGVGSVIVSVPEPSSLALFGLGLAGLGFMARRRRTVLSV